MTIHRAIPGGRYRQRPKGNPRSLGFERYTLGFDGLNQYVEVPDKSILDVTHSTIELCFNSKDVGMGHLFYMGARGDGFGVEDELYIFTNGNDIAFHHYDEGVGFNINIAGSGLLQLGEYFRVFAILNNGIAELFLNKILVGTDTYSAIDTSTWLDKLRIGRHNSDGHPERAFKGLIPLVHLYNQALSAEERAWNMVNYHNPIREGLVLWLPMEEGTGLTVYDKSGLGNNGVLMPVATPPTWEQVRQWELRAETE